MNRIIYTHHRPDLDAAASVWCVKTFVPGYEEAEVRFVPANWDGKELEEEDLAVDIEAGGKGIKGEKGQNGIVHSAFASLMRRYAPLEDQGALTHLVRFVDLQDSRGSVIRSLGFGKEEQSTLSVLSATSLNAVLRALQAKHDFNDEIIIARMSEIFDGLLETERARRRAQEESNRAFVLPGGIVAIVKEPKELYTNAILFERGIRVVIYVDGNNIGLVRSNEEPLRMDHPKIQEVVQKAGEFKEWFAHPAGFLFCRGSRKSPAETPSKVQPDELGEAVNLLLHT